MSRIYQILTQAQDLIRDPAHWTQGADARDAGGMAVGARHPRATCWCSRGAITKCGGGAPFGGFTPDLVTFFKGEPGIVHTNDDKGHAAAMALFDRLRDKAKALEVVA